MSDFMISVGVIKVMGSCLLFVTALLFALNRSAVQEYFEKYITRNKPADFAVAVVTGEIIDFLCGLHSIQLIRSSTLRLHKRTRVFDDLFRNANDQRNSRLCGRI